MTTKILVCLVILFFLGSVLVVDSAFAKGSSSSGRASFSGISSTKSVSSIGSSAKISSSSKMTSNSKSKIKAGKVFHLDDDDEIPSVPFVSGMASILALLGGVTLSRRTFGIRGE